MSHTDTKRDPSPGDFLGPRFWPTWLGYGCIWLIAHLPYRLQVFIGQQLGMLMYHLAKSRRRVCERNIELCFPELSNEEQRRLVKDTFRSNGIGVMEIGLAWCRKPEDFRKMVKTSGLENLIKAHEQGKGVLLVSAHFSTLEFAGCLLSLIHPIDVTYRAHKNPLFDALMKRNRQRLYGDVIERKEVRRAMRRLREGHVLWYAADQDYGPRHSIFVDFFGIPAASITATTKYAGFNNSPVIFLSHYRNPDLSGYHFHFSEPLRDYPTGDDHTDVKRINTLIEAAIRKAPEQYIWLHRRFKTRPPGSPDLYKRKSED
ncbi:LpxL/LpxP family Kdo(2)-lipid IV(A) lauroyl/palmitoleoyl acyltransferase [Pseudohongiella spirulinae]|uniref:Lipid A biosynthesis acyltransferase n=1 Tax=Pseudohongiella spirulinae TaxID=1249552 RepID=A0A0S2K9U1_9GAMM|nr:LpxL/LpxP family Kdo(2)-lipid IV(A) lauroyl/palmitoleoyl acyltransferase [Pseudohongiella spirulinae]ALO45001.1 Lipid A biosynthesis lauroyl acyltransferase [Pseudohongiella spirulinae]